MEANLTKFTDSLFRLKRGKELSYTVIKIVSLGFESTSKSEIENRSKQILEPFGMKRRT